MGYTIGLFAGEQKMPWKECNPMDERLKFIARLLDGEKMAGLCREFGVSRKTGYKILTRYHETGLEGLTDRSRREPFFQSRKGDGAPGGAGGTALRPPWRTLTGPAGNGCEASPPPR